jgi:hypothetical protein
MPTTITIDVDPETAEAYAAATEQEKRKVKMLLRLGLGQRRDDPRTLFQIMDDIGAKAEARGMTPEILESILRGE